MARDGDLPSGITRTATGYRVFQWVQWPGYPRGRVRSKCFPGDRDDPRHAGVAGRAPRRSAAPQARGHRRCPGSAKGFSPTPNAISTRFKTMPTWKERRAAHPRMVRALRRTGDAVDHVADIHAQRDRWLTVGPKRVFVKGTAGSRGRSRSRRTRSICGSARSRICSPCSTRRAESGPRRAEANEPDPQPKGQTFALGYEILSFMPDTSRRRRKASSRKGSLSRSVRDDVGHRPDAAQLGVVRPEHVNWSAQSMLPPRG
jgi:hypothetical protein